MLNPRDFDSGIFVKRRQVDTSARKLRSKGDKGQDGRLSKNRSGNRVSKRHHGRFSSLIDDVNVHPLLYASRSVSETNPS